MTPMHSVAALSRRAAVLAPCCMLTLIAAWSPVALAGLAAQPDAAAAAAAAAVRGKRCRSSDYADLYSGIDADLRHWKGSGISKDLMDKYVP